jgi:hypothetical protein
MVVITIEINKEAWMRAKNYAMMEGIAAYEAYQRIFEAGLRSLSSGGALAQR